MDNKPYISIVLGESGVGKSSFINAITQKKEYFVSDRFESCTKYIKNIEAKHFGQNYIFIDTPGFSYCNDDEKRILKSAIEKYKQEIKCILFLFNFNNRINESYVKNIMDAFSISNFWKHVLIIYTHANKENEYLFEKKKQRIEGSLVKILHSEDFQKFMVNKNIYTPFTLDEFYVNCRDKNIEKTFENNKEEFEKIYLAITSRKTMFEDI